MTKNNDHLFTTSDGYLLLPSDEFLARHTGLCQDCGKTGVRVDTTAGEIVEYGEVVAVAPATAVLLLAGEHGELLCDECADLRASQTETECCSRCGAVLDVPARLCQTCIKEEGEELRCQGGNISGVACSARAEHVVLWIPHHMRGSAASAGVTWPSRNDGYSDCLQLCGDCAEHYEQTEGGWLRILDEPVTL